MTSRSTAYLIAHINPVDLKIRAIHPYSSPPWLLTRQFGPGREIMAVLMEVSGDSYHEALRDLYRVYPHHEPGLSKQFPMEDPDKPHQFPSVAGR